MLGSFQLVTSDKWRVTSAGLPDYGPSQTVSGRLQNHRLQDIGNIFTFVRGGFQDLVNFFPLDHFDGIGGVFKQAGDAFAFDAVGFLFQQGELFRTGMHLAQDALERAQYKVICKVSRFLTKLDR